MQKKHLTKFNTHSWFLKKNKIKLSANLGIQENFLCPTRVPKTECFLTWARSKTRVSSLTTSIQHCTRGSCWCNQASRKSHVDWRAGRRNSLIHGKLDYPQVQGQFSAEVTAFPINQISTSKWRKKKEEEEEENLDLYLILHPKINSKWMNHRPTCKTRAIKTQGRISVNSDNAKVSYIRYGKHEP